MPLGRKSKNILAERCINVHYVTKLLVSALAHHTVMSQRKISKCLMVHQFHMLT